MTLKKCFLISIVSVFIRLNGYFFLSVCWMVYIFLVLSLAYSPFLFSYLFSFHCPLRFFFFFNNELAAFYISQLMVILSFSSNQKRIILITERTNWCYLHLSHIFFYFVVTYYQITGRNFFTFIIMLMRHYMVLFFLILTSSLVVVVFSEHVYFFAVFHFLPWLSGSF